MSQLNITKLLAFETRLRIACDLDLNEDATVGELLQQVARAVSEPVECLRLFRGSSNQRIVMTWVTKIAETKLENVEIWKIRL